MTFPTQSATHDAESAKVKFLRRSAVVTAGSYLYEGGGLVTGWHSHDLHQVEYAVGGVVEVETADAHYLLPPQQQAVWIPAGLRHQATMSPRVRSVAVMFDPKTIAPETIPFAGDRAAIFDVSPLIREMITYAQRWPIGRLHTDANAERFLETLGQLVVEAIDGGEAMLSLPTSDDPVVAAAMAYTNEHLPGVSVDDVSRAVCVSERTLRRLFLQTTGSSWRTYLSHARMLRAMALLASPEQTVQETSRAVGFDNVSSFSRAFAAFSGHTPSAYRQRSAEELV